MPSANPASRKALATAYYQAAPRTSYFQGCSTGGQQALSIAQRQFDASPAGITQRLRKAVWAKTLPFQLTLQQEIKMMTGLTLLKQSVATGQANQFCKSN